jgi:hypothetical protein
MRQISLIVQYNPNILICSRYLVCCKSLIQLSDSLIIMFCCGIVLYCVSDNADLYWLYLGAWWGGGGILFTV